MFTETITENIEESSPRPVAGEFFHVWFVAWLGTVAAGGVFGALEGSVFGLMLGPFYAAFFGLPVIFSFATLTWAFWLTRVTVLIATLAGGCTGFIATALMWDSIFSTDFHTSLLLASIMGAHGAGVSTGLHWIKYRRGHAGNASDLANTWHYSLRDLFFRFTIVATIIACWALAVNAYLAAERTAVRHGPVDDWSQFD